MKKNKKLYGQIIRWMSARSVVKLSKFNDHPELNKFDRRSPFERAYASVIHNSQFRRLSHKTQVYLNSKQDYVRTRLTHSIEVEQIGRQLARHFCQLITPVANYNDGHHYESPRFTQDFEDLVATACLAHDIGQPPFGHAGERKLAELCQKTSLSFDANSQNVRILLGSRFRPALNVPNSLVDAVMKYKNERSFYNEEGGTAFKILKSTGLETYRHPACYLMEAADDIAYIGGDLEDAIKNKIVEKDEVKSKLKKLITCLKACACEFESVDVKLEKMLEEHWERPRFISSQLIGALICYCRKNIDKVMCDYSDNGSLENLPDHMNEKTLSMHCDKQKLNLLYCSSDKKCEAGQHISEFKHWLYRNKILKHIFVVESEHHAKKIIGNLWHDLIALERFDLKDIEKQAAFCMLPSHAQKEIKKMYTSNKIDRNITREVPRFVADYISGMTDRYAIEFHRRLCEPQEMMRVA